MGPAEKGKRMHRVDCVKEHGDRGGWDSPALNLDGVTARAGEWFGANHAHRSSGSHWPPGPALRGFGRSGLWTRQRAPVARIFCTLGTSVLGFSLARLLETEGT